VPDYSLGRAHGKIEIDYDGSGADKAARDLDRVAESSTSADESLSKTQKTLGDTDRQMRSSSTSAEGYSARLRDVRQASDDLNSAEREHNATLLDSKSTIEDIEGSLRNLEDARKRHTTAIDSERDAHNALRDSMSAGERAMDSLKGILPNLTRHFDDLSNAEQEATDKAGGLSKALGIAAKAAMFFGQPEVSAGLYGASEAIDAVSDSADKGGSAIGGFVKDIAGLELAVGKVSGLALGGGALGGLAGLAGGAGLQGIVEVAGAAQQLSGVLGLLPAVIGGVGVVTTTLGVAFQGVDSALTDMMANDPKKFLQDIANMGPAAAQSMLQIAQFRDQFKLGAGAVQDSFFSKIAADIAPLIQTWLPALVSAGSQIAGLLGDAAHQLAELLQQPAAMEAFQTFIANVSAGLQALQPAMAPLLEIFTQFSVVGSSLFQQIGGQITHMLDFFAQLVDKMAASGQLRDWIEDGVEGFGQLINIAYLLGSAFGNVMNIAERFGGGGLLTWLEQVSIQINNWTQSAEGQKALTEFFSLLRQATDAFLPMLPPLVNGLMSIGKAFLELGIATAPGWQDFFNMFAQAMASLGPQIATMGPAINQFLHNMGVALINLVNQVGPQLPALFNAMSNAFSTLLPQIGPLVDAFLQLAEGVGPQLPKFFAAVTSLIEALLPYLPVLIGLVRDFVSVVTWFIEAGAKVIGWFSSFLGAIADAIANLPDTLGKIWDKISNFFEDLPHKALEWGKNLIKGLIDGMLDGSGLGALGGAAATIVGKIADWFQHSPAKVGPFSGDGYTLIRGQQMVKDMAAGMVSAQSAVEDAAQSTATAASTAMGAGVAGAPPAGGADAVAGALLPPNIAGADTSILSAYLKHQFPDNRGLKGLAKDLGKMLEVAQSGFNLINQHVVQPMFQALGMVPGLNQQQWKKMSPEDLAAQQQEELQRKALQDQKKQGPNWQDVLGPGVSPGTKPSASTTSPIKTDSSKQDIANYIINKALAEGYSMDQAKGIATQAYGESGFDPKISGGVQGVDEVIGIFQEMKAFSGGLSREERMDPQKNIDVYFQRLAEHGGPGAADIKKLLAETSVGGPAHPSNVGHWDRAVAGVQPFLEGYQKGAKSGPTWAQVTGAPAPGMPSGVKIGKDGSISVPTGTPLPAAAATQGGLPDAHGAHTQIAQIAAIANRFGLKLTAGKDDHSADGGFHPRGEAGDFSNGQGNTPQELAFAKYMAENFGPLLQELIYSDPNFSQLIGGGKDVTGSYSAKVLSDHTNHVHVALKDENAAAFLQALNGGVPLPGAPTPAVGSALSAGTGSGLLLPSGNTVDQLLDTTSKNVSINDQLLQAYLQGNPALAAQIDAAKTPGASDETTLGALNSISSTITDLKQQDAVGNKNAIQALQSTQNDIAKGAGFQQAPSALSQAQSLASGIGGAISGAFQVAQSYLDALTATQDIADRLVYGVRNTEDVNKLIDDYQKYITLAASIISEAGNIVSAVGAFTGGTDMGGTSAAGTALSLIAGVLQGINAAIDFGQQVYHIVGTYVGRALSFLTAGIGGTPLMGDVRFLLNKNTNQLITYSEDNPQNKNTLNVPNWLQPTYDAGSGSNPNPQVNTQWNIYAGPGQSPGEMLNETMWMYNTAGTTGAMAPANF
jgi:phage-related protein